MVMTKRKFGFFFSLVLLLILALFITVPVQNADAATQRYYGVTTDGPLNVRTGPGTSYSSMGKLQEGTKISITATTTIDDIKWYRFIYQSKQGFVCGKYVKIYASQYFYSTPVNSSVIAGPLNVRSGPSTASTIIGSLGKGSSIKVESIYSCYGGDKWYRITLNAHKGYINAKYVATNIKDGTLVIYNPIKTGTATASITIHTGPDGGYSVCGQKSSGSTIPLLGSFTSATGTKWYLISTQNRVCYISSKYISLIGSSTSQNAQKIVNLALSKVGCAYVYGAEGPNSFDCSGFVYWVVNNSGINGLTVPRTSDALYTTYKSNNIGTNISNARPGDIILFSNNGAVSGICHSAIYYQNGKMIHASTSSTGVIVSYVSYSTTNKSIFAIIRLPGI